MLRVLLALATLLALPEVASASKPKVRLERLDASVDGKLRAYASVVELEGTVLEGLRKEQFTLYVDDKPADGAVEVRRFAQLNEDVFVAFVVEVGAQYKKALPPVREALKDFLEDQPPRFKAMLITFGAETEIKSPLQPAAALADPIADLEPDEDSGDVRMVEAVGAAMTALNKIAPRPDGTPQRRLIVLVSDGLNARMDRQVFRDLGTKARESHLPIHTLAFSPGDERGPLLNLGELSKRSSGTFRWAQKQEDLKDQLATLAEEVRGQYVVTFPSKIAREKLGGHRFMVKANELFSNRVRGDNAIEGPLNPEGSGRAWWVWLIVGLVGALVALYVLGRVLQARGIATREGAAGSPEGPSAPAAPPASKPPRAARPAPARPPRPSTAAAGGAARAAPAPTPSRGTLVGIGGALAGQPIELDRPLTFGKAGQAITIGDDPTVSSRHCEVGRDAAGFYVRDLGSTNGTFVNNQRVAGTHRLGDGDILRLGANTQFKARLG